MIHHTNGQSYHMHVHNTWKNWTPTLHYLILHQQLAWFNTALSLFETTCPTSKNHLLAYSNRCMASQFKLRSPHQCPWPPLQGTLDSHTFWTCEGKRSVHVIHLTWNKSEVFNTLPPTTKIDPWKTANTQKGCQIFTPNAKNDNIGVPKHPPIAQLE